FGVFLCLALATPLLTITLLEATEVRMIEISYGFIAGVVIAAFGRAVALGVFAPDAPQRRLIALDDLTARSLADHLIWATRALGALLVVLAVHKALAAPTAMTIATHMLFALLSGVLLLHLLLSHSGEKTLPLARWLRGLGWLAVGVIAIALIAGYPTFAAFVAARVISISALLGGLYVLLALPYPTASHPKRSRIMSTAQSAVQRAIPLLVPGLRFSSSSPSGSSSCTFQCFSRCDTEIASSDMVFSS